MPQTGITYRNNPLVQLVKASKYANDFELNVTHRITKSQFDMDCIQLVAAKKLLCDWNQSWTPGNKTDNKTNV